MFIPVRLLPNRAISSFDGMSGSGGKKSSSICSNLNRAATVSVSSLVKGEFLWNGPTSDGQLHAKGAALWARAANASTGHAVFESRVILDADVEKVETIAHLASLDSTPRTKSGQ